MANESVSFTINADTRPAGKALLELSRLINKAITADTSGADKNIIAQQKEYKKLGTVVRGVFKDIKRLNDEDKAKGGKAQLPFNQYAANEKKIANLESQKETITDAKELASINAEIKKYKDANATMDKYAEQVLKQILGSEKTIVTDEKSVLGIKTLTTNKTQETASAEEDLVNKTKQTNENLKETANSAKKASDALKDASSKPNTEISSQIDEAAEKARKLQETLETVKSSVAKVDTFLQTTPVSNNIAEMTRQYTQLAKAKRLIEQLGMPAELDASYSRTIYLMQYLNDKIKEYKDNLTGAKQKQDEMKKSGENLKFLPVVAKDLQKSFKQLSKSTSSASRSFDSMARSMKSHFKHLITSITKYVLGFRSLFFLVRRMRRYLGEGIKNLAQFNNGNNIVNESITDLLSSLLYLKNAWAAAFSPIITTVRPYLVALLDDLAAVGNTIARFLSALFGQEVAFNAVRVRAADYADSLDNVGSSAGSAADKTKKLTDRLAAFDDLNVLGVDKDPNGTGSGGGGGLADAYAPDPNEMFKIVDPEENGFLSALKKAWQEADFTEVGAIIRDKLIDLLNIDWDTAEEKTKQFGSAVGQFLVGLFGDPSFWTALGDSFGEGLNTITEGIKSFLQETEGVDFGGSLAEGLNAFNRTTDFYQSAKNISDAFGQLTDNVTSFLDTLNKEDAAKAMTDFLKGLEIPKNAGKLFTVAVKLTATAIEISADALANASDDLAAWLQKEATKTVTLKVVDENGNPLKVNAADSDWTTSPIQAAVEGMLFDIGRWFMEDLVGVDSLEDIEIISNLLQEIRDFLLGDKNSGMPAHNTGGYGKDEKGLYKTDKQGNKTYLEGESAGSDFMAGFWSVIKMSPAEAAWKYIVQPIIEAVTGKDGFDMHSPSKVTAQWGVWIVEGIYNGITEKIMTVLTPFIKLKNSLFQIWQQIKDDAWTKFTLMRVAILDIFNTLKDTLKTPINGIIGFIEKMINGIIKGINKGINAISTFANGLKFPDWFKDVPGVSSLAGKGFGFTLGTLSEVSLPRLAQGAVIPPNREFMAVLGDQSHGTNIEAPLDTIKQAVAEVLANNGNAEVIQLLQQLIAVVESKNLTIGDKEIGKANARYVSQQQIIRGTGW